MEPPLVLICILKTTPCYYAFEEAGAFVINILSESQREISNQFAGRHEDKFSGIDIVTSAVGLPVIKGCLANFECRLKHSYNGGDHTIFVGEIEKATVHEGKPLVYFAGKYREITD
jgi:flavin reductase (DIM6/NTAB) family NADH-FMN oxidoreductase RutF